MYLCFTLCFSTPPYHFLEIQSMTQRTEYFEYCLLFDALQRHRGRLKEVQLELQVSRKTLYDKLKKHQLDKAKFKA